LLSEFIGELKRNHVLPEFAHKDDSHECNDALHDEDHVRKDGHLFHAADAHHDEEAHLGNHAHDVSDDHSPSGHEKYCAHHPALNVMLIERVKASNIKNFAIRVDVGSIDVTAWEEVAAVEKRIILGSMISERNTDQTSYLDSLLRVLGLFLPFLLHMSTSAHLVHFTLNASLSQHHTSFKSVRLFQLVPSTGNACEPLENA
jgi:hypothetical protein